MSRTMVASRVVLVVFGTANGVVPEAADVPECERLVLLSVGWPVTEVQRRAIDTVTSLAYERAIILDAVLVPSAAEVLDHLATDDVVRVYGKGRARKRLDRSLRGVGVTVPSAR